MTACCRIGLGFLINSGINFGLLSYSVVSAHEGGHITSRLQLAIQQQLTFGHLEHPCIQPRPSVLQLSDVLPRRRRTLPLRQPQKVPALRVGRHMCRRLSGVLPDKLFPSGFLALESKTTTAEASMSTGVIC